MMHGSKCAESRKDVPFLLRSSAAVITATSDSYGKIWTSLDKFGQIWTNLNRSRVHICDVTKIVQIRGRMVEPVKLKIFLS